MKTNRFRKRSYRDRAGDEELFQERVAVKETDLQVFTDKPVDKDFIKERIGRYRRDIEGYIAKDRRFLTALKPIGVELSSPPIVKRMSEAARLANVGPMAAVAGAIAEFLGKDLLRKGYKDIIIENGGDIFIKASKARRIGIYAGKSSYWNKLSLEIKSKDTPLGVCTSSGMIGHSLSFGRALAVTVLSKNAALADAAATAVGNRIGVLRDLNKAADFAKSVKGISGVVIIMKNRLLSWGQVRFAP